MSTALATRTRIDSGVERRCRLLLSRLRHEIDRLPAGAAARQRAQEGAQVLVGIFDDIFEAGKFSSPSSGDFSEAETAKTPLMSELATNEFHATDLQFDEILQLLAFNRKTGTLRVRMPEENVELDVREGWVVDMRSDNAPPRQSLGEILVARRYIGREQLYDYCRRNEGSSKRLGRGLLTEGLVRRKQVRRALHIQLLHALQRCLSAREFDLEFLPVANRYGSPDFHYELNALLLEISAIFDRRRSRR